MKGFWIIVFMIIVLVPLFMISRGKDNKGIERTENEVSENDALDLPVPDEEEVALYESKSIFRMHMKSLDEYDEALAVSIESQNWDDIRKYAMLLKKTSPVIYTGKRKMELPKEFIILDTFFHLQSLAVAQAAQSREMVSLNIEYEKLQQTCDDCHEKYKKKE